MKLTAPNLFVPRIIAIVLILLTTACSKEVIYADPVQKVTDSTPSFKLNTNGCPIIAGAIGSTYMLGGNAWIDYSISWTNQGGKKFIKVIPEGAAPFFIDVSAATGLYSWSQRVTSLFGIFTFRTITYTAGSPGEGAVCKDQIWSIAIDPLE